MNDFRFCKTYYDLKDAWLVLALLFDAPEPTREAKIQLEDHLLNCPICNEVKNELEDPGKDIKI